MYAIKLTLGTMEQYMYHVAVRCVPTLSLKGTGAYALQSGTGGHDWLEG